MGDEAAETSDGAIRAYIGAIGFTLVLKGADLMAEDKGTVRFLIGVALLLAALPVNLSWVFWRAVKARLNTAQRTELSSIATSIRWWLGAVFFVLAFITLSPFIEQGRVPFANWTEQAKNFEDFASEHKNELGNPSSSIVPADSIYESWNENGRVVTISGLTSLICAIPTAQSANPAHCESLLGWPSADDKRFYPWEEPKDDTYLRALFKDKGFPIPPNRFPPAGGIATLWLGDMNSWNWIGAVVKDCNASSGSYYRSFEHGVIIGPVPINPGDKQWQMLAVVTGKDRKTNIYSRNYTGTNPACKMLRGSK